MLAAMLGICLETGSLTKGRHTQRPGTMAASSGFARRLNRLF